MTTLLSIIISAIEGIGEHEVPGEIATSTDDLSRQLKSLANELGTSLVLDHDFQEVLTEHSFSTVASTSLYNLPSGFKKIEAETFWDETNSERIVGPIGNKEFNLYKKGIITLVGDVSIFRRIGNQIEIYPVPTTVRDLSFDYYSLNWAYDEDGSTEKDRFTADSDTLRLDDMLFQLGMKLKFLEAHGEDTVLAERDFMLRKNNLLGIDRSQGTLSFIRSQPKLGDNIPDTGYGTTT